MKKIVILLILFSSWYLNINATHNKGGYITYKHLSNLTYEITIFTYTDLTSPADRSELEVNWGDDIISNIPRISQEVVENNIQKSTYIGNHTYTCPKQYTISLNDPNRNSGILNIPNSVNVPFHIEAELFIPMDTSFNNSVDLFAPFVFYAETGKPFTHNLAAYDMDKDNLTFELIPSKNGIDQSIPGYTLPSNFSIDAINGEITWSSPQQQGDYVFTIKITECRDGQKVGSVLVDIQITVVPSFAINQFQGLATWSVDTNNNYSVTMAPNDSIELSLAYTESMTSSMDLLAYGEPFELGNSATFLADSIAFNFIRKKIKWRPSIANLRCQPYIITLRASSTFSDKINNDVTLTVYVNDPSLPNCSFTCASYVDTVTCEVTFDELTLYPNPTKDQLTIASEFTIQELIIFDMTGKQIKNTKHNSNKVSLNVRNLSAGVYIIKLIGADNTATRKILKYNREKVD